MLLPLQAVRELPKEYLPVTGHWQMKDRQSRSGIILIYPTAVKKI